MREARGHAPRCADPTLSIVWRSCVSERDASTDAMTINDESGAAVRGVRHGVPHPPAMLSGTRRRSTAHRHGRGPRIAAWAVRRTPGRHAHDHATAWVVGFGATSPNGGGGRRKHQVEVMVNELDKLAPGTINVGDARSAVDVRSRLRFLRLHVQHHLRQHRDPRRADRARHRLRRDAVHRRGGSVGARSKLSRHAR